MKKIALLVLATIILLSQLALANENRIVRVGFFPQPGFNQHDELGNYSGYNIDYLNEISNYTNWQYQFIQLDSWVEALKMLEEKKIDLLAPSQKTTERENEFLFSSYPIGTEYGSLLTLNTNHKLIYEDFAAFSQIKIGCVKSLIFKDDFLLYAKRNGFTPQIIYYKDSNALLAALNVGEVDAVVANLMLMKKNMKLLAKFSPAYFYYMTYQGNQHLIDQLDAALQEIKLNNPGLDNILDYRYYALNHKIPFTKEELNYIKNSPVFTVGCIPNNDPVSYFDSNTKQVAGITRDILDEIEKISGLQFHYEILPEGTITYEYLSQHKINILAGIEINSLNKNNSKFKLTYPYLISGKYLVGRKGEKFFYRPGLRLAVVKKGKPLLEVIKKTYPQFAVLPYENIEQCLDAVKKQQVDLVLHDKYVLSRYLVKPKYESLAVINNKETLEQFALGLVLYQNQEKILDPIINDERLISILNKSLVKLKVKTLENIILTETINRPYKFTLADFLYKYKISCIIFLLSILIIGAISLYTWKLRKSNLRIIQDNERRLKNITNNINGGVVVLTLNQGFKITYANEGFLDLLLYNKDDYEKINKQNYITYVHPDDISILNQLIETEEKRKDNISVHLRICRKDGAYIPILFNGTLVKNKKEEMEMYCVILDVSEQVKMIEKLELEQERYEFLITKSENIIFDYDFILNKITVSDKFEKKFGWKLDSTRKTGFTFENWNIDLRDKEKFKQMLETLWTTDDGDCIVRIMRKDQTFIWCRLSLHIMRKRDKRIRIIGKITDVNADIKEKERLKYKSEIDALTGLCNKTAFYDKAKQYLEENKQENAAFIFMDLDNFKQVNDQLGHLLGDQVLKETAKRLQVIFSHSDIIARFGGDEFCILTKNIPLSILQDKLEWTVEKMRKVYYNNDLSVEITSSIGAVHFIIDEESLENLLDHADKALYQAKEAGKNQFILYSK